MNKNQYRLVYNRARNLLMVVSENVQPPHSNAESSTHLHKVAGATNGGAKYNQQQTLFIHPLKFALMLALGMAGFVPNSVTVNRAYADIIADQSAPANQRPMVTNAANGVPLVNIQTPSVLGVIILKLRNKWLIYTQ